MKMLVVGDCTPAHRYELVDASAATEAHLETHVARALHCYRPGYRCIPFRGSFELEGRRFRPDLALVASDYSHWFVIEVELVSHSLSMHVIPQVRAIRWGDPDTDCIASLALGLEIGRGQAETLLHLVPRAVVVVANKRLPEWGEALYALDVQLVGVATFRAPDGTIAYEIDGDLAVLQTSLGFGTFSATDNALRLPSAVEIPDGDVQLVEPGGGCLDWHVVRDGGVLWVSRVRGFAEFAHGEQIQLIRTLDGRLLLRRFRP